jgi:hypothetical protein
MISLFRRHLKQRYLFKGSQKRNTFTAIPLGMRSRLTQFALPQGHSLEETEDGSIVLAGMIISNKK